MLGVLNIFQSCHHIFFHEKNIKLEIVIVNYPRFLESYITECLHVKLTIFSDIKTLTNYEVIFCYPKVYNCSAFNNITSWQISSKMIDSWIIFMVFSLAVVCLLGISIFVSCILYRLKYHEEIDNACFRQPMVSIWLISDVKISWCANILVSGIYVVVNCFLWL